MNIELIKREIEVRKKLLQELKNVNAELAATMSNVQKNESVANLPVVIQKTTSLQKPSITTAESVVAMAQELLANGNKLTSAELYNEAIKRDIAIGGKDPKTGLAAILSRNKSLFEPSKKHGWSLKDESDNAGTLSLSSD